MSFKRTNPADLFRRLGLNPVQIKELKRRLAAISLPPPSDGPHVDKEIPR